MKKIPVLILIMLCANLAFGQTPTLSISKGITGTAGSTITVPVNVTNVTGKEYYSFRVAVAYDTTILRATGYSLTGAIIPSSGWTIIENKNDASVVPGAVNANVRPYILVGATGGGALSGAGVLLSITFQVKVSTPAGKSPLSMFSTLPAGSRLNSTLENDLPAVVSGSYGPPFTPTPASPADGAALVPRPTTLAWNPAIGAATYKLQVSTSATFATFLYNDSTLTDTSKSMTTLAEGTTYYWRLSAKNPAGSSDYSATSSFSTEVGIPAVPTHVSPANAATNVSAAPMLIWHKVLGATTYHLQVSGSGSFLATVYDNAALTDTAQTVTGLSRNTQYYWHVSATGPGGTSAYSGTATFTTQPPGPVTPILVLPLDNSVDVDIAPAVFAWSPSDSADTYRLQVSTSATFATTVFDQDTLTLPSQTITGLTRGTDYYWRVSATNSQGTSPFATTRKFTTIPFAPAAPSLTAPADNAVGIAVNPTLSWTASANATAYLLQVSETNLFITTIVNDSSITGTSKQIAGLSSATTYYWRVRAKNSGGSSDFTDPRSFTTALTAPTLVSPANSATDQDTSLVLRWTRIQGATNYHVQLSKNSGFTTTVVNDSSLTDTSLTVSGLDNSTTYYWRVRALSASANSAFTAARSFLTKSGSGIEQLDRAIPGSFSLSQNFPNPFNPTTSVEISIPKQSYVTVDVYDVLGHRILSLMHGEKSPGTYRVSIDASSLASGTYFYTMKAGNFVSSKKFTLIK